MPLLKSALSLCAAFVLTACAIESPEDKVARLEQFQGKTLEQVTTRIGPPTLSEGKTAIWLSNEVHIYHDPQYEYIYGIRMHVATVTRTERRYCKYTATLSHNRVKSGVYEGNSCLKYAPRLPKKS